jgi:hypothetical protein
MWLTSSEVRPFRVCAHFQFLVPAPKSGLAVATPEIISDNPRLMMTRLFRVVWLLVWLELGLVLILVPWSEVWETNYFLYQYPSLAFFVNNPFMRGAISGLGIMNVFLALEAFRRRAVTVASQG